MIKHIVMWKLKESADGKDKAENAKKIKDILEALQNRIEEIKFIEVGINISQSVQAYDVVLYSEFENESDLATYQNHPEHIKVSEFISKVRTERVVVDFQV